MPVLIRDDIVRALYSESRQNCSYSRPTADPGGRNEIVMFKSCFPNARLTGSPADPVPPIGSNPLRGQDAGSDAMTLANAKGIYVEILSYFATRPDVLLVAVVNPPLGSFDTDPATAANARALADWLVNDWLRGYTGRNVAVFDFFSVLTSNGGSTRTNDPNTNDLGWSDGNHHRIRDGTWQHLKTVAYDMSAYAAGGDSHPTQAGNLKATGVAYIVGPLPDIPTASAPVAISSSRNFVTAGHRRDAAGSRSLATSAVSACVSADSTP